VWLHSLSALLVEQLVRSEKWEFNRVLLDSHALLSILPRFSAR